MAQPVSGANGGGRTPFASSCVVGRRHRSLWSFGTRAQTATPVNAHKLPVTVLVRVPAIIAVIAFFIVVTRAFWPIVNSQVISLRGNADRENQFFKAGGHYCYTCGKSATQTVTYRTETTGRNVTIYFCSTCPPPKTRYFSPGEDPNRQPSGWFVPSAFIVLLAIGLQAGFLFLCLEAILRLSGAARKGRLCRVATWTLIAVAVWSIITNISIIIISVIACVAAIVAFFLHKDARERQLRERYKYDEDLLRSTRNTRW